MAIKYSDQKRRKKKVSVLFIRNVPKHIHDHFKAYCSRRGISMTSKLISLMKSVLDTTSE